MGLRRKNNGDVLLRKRLLLVRQLLLLRKISATGVRWVH